METSSRHNGIWPDHKTVSCTVECPCLLPSRPDAGYRIVGLAIGAKLGEKFSQIQGYRARGLCDFSRQRLDHIKGRYPSVMVTEQLVRSWPIHVDAVVVATPVNIHFEKPVDV